MIILIVCGEFFNKSNGLSVSTQRFVKEFMRQGQQVRVLADDRGGKADYTVPVIHVPFFNGIMEAQNYFFAKPDRRVVKEALDWADLVHIEDPFPLSAVVVREARRRGIPITGTFHLYPENITSSLPAINFKLSNRNIMNLFRWSVFKYCYAIQCPTEKVRKRLKHSGYKAKLYTISNGILPEDIAEKPCTDKHEHFTIISVGRYSNEKDQKTLMKAIRGSCHASEIDLILAGKGPLEKQYRKLGKTLPNPPVMHFYDRSELREAVRRADLYVHCANVEVEGMGCMEAFAAGTVPVIADSALSSTSAYALSEQNRYKAGNVKELTRKIDYWFEHRADLPKVGEDYIALAKTLSIEESARKVIAMMEDTAKAFEK